MLRCSKKPPRYAYTMRCAPSRPPSAAPPHNANTPLLLAILRNCGRWWSASSMRCWSWMKIRRCAATAWPCWRSCVHCLPASPISHACRAEHAKRRMQLFRSLIFTTFFFLWTFAYGIVFSLVCPFLPFHRRFGFARVWGIVILKALRWTCGLDYRVEDRENLPPGNHIALWKHSSSWETVAMAVVIPRQVWVLKRELTWIPFVGWSIRLLHAIAIDRKSGHSAVSQVVRQGKQRLAEGNW